MCVCVGGLNSSMKLFTLRKVGRTVSGSRTRPSAGVCGRTAPPAWPLTWGQCARTSPFPAPLGSAALWWSSGSATGCAWWSSAHNGAADIQSYCEWMQIRESEGQRDRQCETGMLMFRVNWPASPYLQSCSRGNAWWCGRRCRLVSAVGLEPTIWPELSAVRMSTGAWIHPVRERIQAIKSKRAMRPSGPITFSFMEWSLCDTVAHTVNSVGVPLLCF